MTATLAWGSTSLLPDETSSVGFSIEAVADGTAWGNPESVVTAIKSRLQDGSLAEVTSFENRQATVRIRVSSDSYDGLAAGESVLVGETNVPGYNTLTWSPNQMLARPTVFDVVYSSLAFEFDDLAETKRGTGSTLRRTFVATLECLPFGRDQSPTTVQATAPDPPLTPTTISVADGSTTSGWSTSGGATLTSSGGQVRATGGSPLAVGLGYSTPFDVTATRYLWFDWATADFNAGPRTLMVNGTTLDPVLELPAPTFGLTRTYVLLPGALGNTVTSFSFVVAVASSAGAQQVSIDQLSRSNTLPTLGTNRQQSRTLTVGGSARARASLSIAAAATETLGALTVLYSRTAATGLQPPLRTWRLSSSSVTVDANLVSGARNALGTTMRFLIPANLFREAAHELACILRATTAGTYDVTWFAALTAADGSTIAETVVVESGSVSLTFETANEWGFYDLGIAQLPTVPVASDSNLRIVVGIQASNAVVQIDEGYLFDLDNGVLSVVDTTDLTRLEARTADLTNPEPSYWGGTVDGGAATGLVRADWRVRSWGTHVVEPGRSEVFTVTTGTGTAACDLTYHRSFLHHATAEDAA